MSSLHIWGSRGDPVGDAVFVGHVSDLNRFKTGPDPKVFYVNRPLVFTHNSPPNFAAPMDFLDCHFEFGPGGSVHGYDGIAQQLTASTLNPAIPLLKFSGVAVIEAITVVGVGIALDLDGAIAGPVAVANIRNFVTVFCGTAAVIKNYGSLALTESLFASSGAFAMTDVAAVAFRDVVFSGMTGGVTLQGVALGAAALQKCIFSPLDGVTAFSVPESVPPSSFASTLDLTTSVFNLDFPGSIAFAVHEDTIFGPEQFDARRVIVTKTAGGAPVGIAIPSPGYLTAASNLVHFSRCSGFDNSKTEALVTMTGNLVATDMLGLANTPVPVAVSNLVVQTSAKFTVETTGPNAGRITFVGGINERIRVVCGYSVSAGNNKVVRTYMAVGDTATPTPVAIVDYTVTPVTTNAGGKSESATVRHTLDVVAGRGDYFQVYAETADASNPIFSSWHFEAYMLPA